MGEINGNLSFPVYGSLPIVPEDVLFRKRIISLSDEIDSMTSEMLRNEILTLDAVCKEPITLYISSPGGCLDSGLAIYDIMNFVESPVATVCYGMAASMAAVILAGGENGMRYIFPHSRVMIHQAEGGAIGSIEDMEIYHKELKRGQDAIATILAKNTKKTKKKILEDIKIDKWFDAKGSVKYGLVDKVITSYKDLK